MEDHRASLVRAIATVWPGTPASKHEHVKQAVANYLVMLPPPHSSNESSVHQALSRTFGNLKAYMGHGKLTGVLAADKHFIADRPGHKPSSVAVFSLNVSQLLHSGSALPPEQLPPLVTAEQVLTFVNNRCWDSHTEARNSMKRAVAEDLVYRANPGLLRGLGTAAASASPLNYLTSPDKAVSLMRAAVGKPPLKLNKQDPKFKTDCQHLLGPDPYFIVKRSKPNQPLNKGQMTVELNISDILRDISAGALGGEPLHAAVVEPSAAVTAAAAAAAAAAGNAVLQGVWESDGGVAGHPAAAAAAAAVGGGEGEGVAGFVLDTSAFPPLQQQQQHIEPEQQQQQQEEADEKGMFVRAPRTHAADHKWPTRLSLQLQQQQQHAPQRQQQQQPPNVRAKRTYAQTFTAQPPGPLRYVQLQEQQQQQPALQMRPQLMPLPASLQPLAAATAAECAAAAVCHMTEQQVLLELNLQRQQQLLALVGQRQQQQMQQPQHQQPCDGDCNGPAQQQLQQQMHTCEADDAFAYHNQQQQQQAKQQNQSSAPLPQLQQQQQLRIQELLQHIAAAKLVGLDLEFACSGQQQQQQQRQQPDHLTTRQIKRQKIRSVRDQQQQQQQVDKPDRLALIQIVVPGISSNTPDQPTGTVAAAAAATSSSAGAKSCPVSSSNLRLTKIYILEVPQQQAAAQQLLQQLKPWIESSDVVKVMHDAREDSCMLQQHYGIGLRSVLDTQLLAGLAALAASSSSNSHGGGNLVLEGISSNGSSSRHASLARLGLGKLYEMFGFPHPNKSAIAEAFRMSPSYWYQRPLSPAAVAYASDDVRFLLPLASSLLQQMPAAALALGDLQLLLAQQQKQLIPGYASLLDHRSSSSSNGGGKLTGVLRAGPAAAAAAQQQRQLGQADGLTSIWFELQLERDLQGGWFMPRFQLYLNEDHKAGSSSSSGRLAGPQIAEPSGSGAPPNMAAAASAAAAAALDNIPGGDQLLAPASSPEMLTGTAAAAAVAGVACGAGADLSGIDEAVQSMASLLPSRLQADLAPYMHTSRQPALVEITADRYRNILFRLSNRTTVELNYSLDVQLALEKLAAARQQQPCDNFATCYNSLGQPEQRTSQDMNAQAPSEAFDFQDDFIPLLGSHAGTANPLALGHSQQQRGASTSASPSNLSALSTMFGSDNRLGIPGTLHRISAIKDREGFVYGLSYRIGRHVPGVAELLADVLSSMKASITQSNTDCSGITGFSVNRPRSLLILGQPGVGKTTLLRDIARIASLSPSQGGLGLSVMIVDTSNEICGDSEVVHPCIGNARRMMVPRRVDQAAVLVEAVQNHNPDVIIVDEIGTPQEVAAARTISQRGVLLIGTAHGNNLSTLLRNPELAPLVGGVQAVTLGDVEARASNRGHKVRLERAGAATFVTLLELQERNRWRLHLDVEQSVDIMLSSSSSAAAGPQQRGGPQHLRQSANTQTRCRDNTGRLMVHFETEGAAKQALAAAEAVEAAATAAGAGVGSMSGDGVVAPIAGGLGRSAEPKQFAGGWLVDLLHAAVHRSVQGLCS